MSALARAKWIGLLLLVLLYSSQLYVSLFVKPQRGDLGLVLDAAHRLYVGDSIYDSQEYHTHTKPPITTMVFVPLGNLPRFWAERLWDALLLGSFFWFAFWLARKLPKRSQTNNTVLVLLALALTFNSLNAEVVFGQFNWMLLMAAAAAVYMPGNDEGKSTSRSISKLLSAYGSYLGGALYTFSLFFKPTQIVFAPWIWRFNPERGRLFLGGVGLLGFLAILYGVSFGWDALVADHAAWWKKTGGITPMHVAREDNNGLASFATGLGMPANQWAWFQILGLITSAVFSFRIRDRFRAFSLVACITILASPMAWRYVYVLAFPFALRAWDDAIAETATKAKCFYALSLASYFWGTQFYNPETAKLSYLAWMFANRPPLLGLVLALAFWGLAEWQRKVFPDKSFAFSSLPIRPRS
jgi:hypothetical protein